MDILIRSATTADLPATRRLLVTTWHDTYDALIGPAKVRELTDRWHAIEALAGQLDGPGRSFLVAEAPSTEIVGHAFAQLPSPSVLVLNRLYVLPSQQRRGIGDSLLAALAERHPEARTLRLTVEAANAKGLAFYRGQGFVRIGEAVDDGIDVLRLEKQLTR